MSSPKAHVAVSVRRDDLGALIVEATVNDTYVGRAPSDGPVRRNLLAMVRDAIDLACQEADIHPANTNVRFALDGVTVIELAEEGR